MNVASGTGVQALISVTPAGCTFAVDAGTHATVTAVVVARRVVVFLVAMAVPYVEDRSIGAVVVLSGTTNGYEKKKTTRTFLMRRTMLSSSCHLGDNATPHQSIGHNV